MDYSFETLLYGTQFRKLLEKLLEPVEKEYQLNKVDLQILFFLNSAGMCNTSKDIMELKMFTRGHISQALGHLQKNGYILIKQDREDRRCIHNCLTEKADAIVQKLQVLFQQAEDIIFQGVTPEERAVLKSSVQKINRNINEVLSS